MRLLACVCVCDSHECACDSWVRVCVSCMSVTQMSVCDLWLSV